MFESLECDVHLVYFTEREVELARPGERSELYKKTEALLGELTTLTDRLSLEVRQHEPERDQENGSSIDKIPAIVIEAPRVQGTLRYFGMPSGCEFAVLLGAIVDAGTTASGLSVETLSLLENISEDAHIQVFVTPT